MKQKTTAVLAIILIAIVSASLIITIELVNNHEPAQPPEFFFGVDFAPEVTNTTSVALILDDLKGVVDEVRNYTNLFVIGTPDLTFNQTVLNEACDYIYNAGLNFVILFTTPVPKYYSYDIPDWIVMAKQTYGGKFLAVYRYDEPGGNQLDSGSSVLVESAQNYTDAAENYVSLLEVHINYNLTQSPSLLTADYGLYWFDYQAGYDTVLTEFGSNQSRDLSVALCRGAAEAQNKDWGAIITWTYDQPPYIESASELYSDLVLAYEAGAKYAVVFDYGPMLNLYGILTPAHFDAMERFWNYVQGNPQNFGINRGTVAYVLPQDYGFGFRNPNDKIWGLWNADALSPKVWDDANNLIAKYDSRLNIVYDDPEFIDNVIGHYEKLFFWNETIT